MEYWCTHCRTHWKAPGGSTLHKGTTTYLNASTIIRPLKLCMPMNFLRTSMLNSLLWNMRGRVNLNTYIGIVLTMKSYKLVSCCWRQRQNTVHTLSTSVFQKSVLFGFSTKSFEWQTHQVWIQPQWSQSYRRWGIGDSCTSSGKILWLLRRSCCLI